MQGWYRAVPNACRISEREVIPPYHLPGRSETRVSIDPKRLSGAALLRYKDVYRDIAAGKITGLSIARAYAKRSPR